MKSLLSTSCVVLNLLAVKNCSVEAKDILLDTRAGKLQVADMNGFENETIKLNGHVSKYKDEDFEGLFKYLAEDTCDGPNLLMCDVGDKNSVPVEDYLLNIDQCLHNNNCLSYHQILSYKHKLNEND